MSTDKTGGPAFPCINPHYDGNWIKEPIIGGMTLRDYFAAKALQGICANSNDALLIATGKGAMTRGETRTSQTFAREAYEMADAMLAEREKSQ